jgi:hypothetical protein
MSVPLDATGFLAEQRLREWDRRYSAPMPNMPNMSLIAKAAMDYVTTVLGEYPDAADSGLGLSVSVNNKTYTVTLTPANATPIPPPAPEELLLTEPDTQVSNPDEN